MLAENDKPGYRKEMSYTPNKDRIRTHRLHSRERRLCYNSVGFGANIRQRRAYAVPLRTVDHSQLDPQLETEHSILMANIDQW